MNESACLYEQLAALCRQPEPLDRLQFVCQAAVELLGVTGVAVTLVSHRPPSATALSTICASDDAIRQLGDLQHLAGQGPSLDATELGRSVREPDLAARGSHHWPGLTDSARGAGFAALFSFPLQLDGVTVATLDAYRDHPGELTGIQVVDAHVLAATSLRELLELPTTSYALALSGLPGDLSPDRAVIEQAAGMVAVQLATSVSEATRRLQTYARDHGRQVADVARDVVDRTLRFN